jgi:hypothetical protein
MENKINIAEILKDCPKGMELDCTICNGVKFVELDRNPNFPIVVRANNGYEFTLTKYGQVHNIDDAKCVIFPKGKITWEEFVPPCEFKDGDIIFTHADSLKMGLGNTWISIFKENSAKGVVTYAGIKEDGSSYYDNTDEEKGLLCSHNDIVSQRLATEEEKQKLFDAIKANGYRWNSKAKTLEKLIEPKFKVGDKIQHKNGYSLDVSILKINADCYTVKDFMGDQITIDFTHQDNYELVPDKFDLNTLKSFESSVLIRNSKDQYWIPAFWGYKAKDGYVTTFGHSIYCIPFEGNEHLLKTKNDCDEYFKTWE